jgi:hypothetical protein
LKTDKPMVKNEEMTADIVPEHKLLSNFWSYFSQIPSEHGILRIAKNEIKFTAK